jgi:hypothetical protein
VWYPQLGQYDLELAQELQEGWEELELVLITHISQYLQVGTYAVLTSRYLPLASHQLTWLLRN